MNKKFPVTIQDETWECGLACINSILNFYGCQVNMNLLRSRYDVTSNGLSFTHLVHILNSFGVTARGVKLTYSDIDKLSKPSILLWNQSHFIVVTEYNRKCIKIMDPGIGNRQFDHLTGCEYFSGFALEIVEVKPECKNFKLDKEFIDKKNIIEYNFKEFMNDFGKNKNYIIPIIFISILLQLISVISAKLTAIVVDEVLPKNDLEFMILLVYIFSVVFFGNMIFSLINNYLTARFSFQLDVVNSSRVFKSILLMPLEFYSKRTASSIIRKIRSIDSLPKLYSNIYIEIFVAIIGLLIFGGLLMSVNSSIAGAVMALAAAIFGVKYLYINDFESLVYDAFDAEVVRDNLTISTVQSINEIKFKKFYGKRISNWANRNLDFKFKKYILARKSGELLIFSSSAGSFQALMVLTLGVFAITNGEMTLGALFAFVFFKDQFLLNVNKIFECLAAKRLILSELYKLKDVRVDNDSDNGYEWTPLPGFEFSKLTLSNVSFAYTKLDCEVIKNVDLEINCGEKIYIVGASGSGKSTLINIILNLYKQTHGSILVNGSLSLTKIGKNLKISAYLANQEIYDGTLIDNIIDNDEKFDQKKLNLAMKNACIDEEMILQLPSGLSTYLGPGGSILSSGQYQRLFLARAFYSNPDLLLLDEPTSHLDIDIAKKITNNISKMKCSVILITHSIELKNICHRGYTLDKGVLKPD